MCSVCPTRDKRMRASQQSANSGPDPKRCQTEREKEWESVAQRESGATLTEVTRLSQQIPRPPEKVSFLTLLKMQLLHSFNFQLNLALADYTNDKYLHNAILSQLLKRGNRVTKIRRTCLYFCALVHLSHEKFMQFTFLFVWSCLTLFMWFSSESAHVYEWWHAAGLGCKCRGV